MSFHVLALLTSAEMNIGGGGVRVSFWIMVFSGYRPRSGIPGSYGSFRASHVVPGGTEPTCHHRSHIRLRSDPWVRKIPWRRAWQPPPVFLPGESRGQRSLAGYGPWGRRVRQDWSGLARTHTRMVVLLQVFSGISTLFSLCRSNAGGIGLYTTFLRNVYFLIREESQFNKNSHTHTQRQNTKNQDHLVQKASVDHRKGFT